MAGQRNDYGKRSSNPHSDYGGGKRHNPSGEDSGDLPHGIGSDDTVGGEIAKQLRAETKSSIRISESIPGFEERIVTVYSSSDEEEDGGGGDLVCPAQHALFLVHDRVVAEERGREEEEREEEGEDVSVRMLVPSDQIGCVIGKGGQVIQGIRSETGAQIRILKDEHLPPFALTNDELLQPAVVRMALMQVANRLHENPSRFQHLLLSTSNNPYQSGGGMFVPPNAGVPAMGAYGGYKGGWPDSRDDAGSAREFAIRLVCPIGNITTRILVPRSQVGCLMGKGGSIISEMRSVTRASIRILSEDNLPKVASEDDEMVQVID
ncbi:KH domain-containing protein At4g18375 [Linum perenne]